MRANREAVPPSQPLFISAHPIFTRDKKVSGYELLCQSDSEFYALGAPDPEHDASDIISNALHTIGLDSLVGTSRAFIRASEEPLRQGFFSLLPPQRVAIEVQPEVTPSTEIFNILRDLKNAGSLIVLDSYHPETPHAQLLEFADIIKFDFTNTADLSFARMINDVRQNGIQLLANGVLTHDDYATAVHHDFDLFQGRFFAAPRPTRSNDIPQSQAVAMNLIKVASADNYNTADVVSELKKDIGLTYKFLRYCTSALFGWGSRIKSIDQGVKALGSNGLRRWAALMLLGSSTQGSSDELHLHVISRARHCELVAKATEFRGRSDELFLLGMMSLMDSLMGRDLEDILGQLPLSQDVNDALLGKSSPLKPVYDYVIAYERGLWAHIDRLLPIIRLDQATAPKLYQQARGWAKQLAAVTSPASETHVAAAS